MGERRIVTGVGKVAAFLCIALGTAFRYALRPSCFGWSPFAYARFLRRALVLLLLFRRNKIVRTAGGWKVHFYFPAYPSPAFFHALEAKLLRAPPGPTTVVFSMTKACTYRCTHCYQRRDAGSDMDEPLLLATARAVQETGVAMFDIEGGEPFLRFERLLALVRALDERSEVWINTNGAGVEPGMLEALREEGLFGVMVSLHSPDSAAHDAFTGVPGSHDVACAFLRRCRELDLTTAVNSVLAEGELRGDGLDSLMALAKDLRCDFVQLIHPKPSGLWLGREEHMQMDPVLLAAVRRQNLRYNSRETADHPSLAAQVYEEAGDMLGCTAGAIDRFYVNAHGEVQPCEFLNLSFGNVNGEPFEVIYERMRAAFPHPCADWLCCTQARHIAAAVQAQASSATPLAWECTRELVRDWSRGEPTPVYRRLGIYK